MHDTQSCMLIYLFFNLCNNAMCLLCRELSIYSV